MKVWKHYLYKHTDSRDMDCDASKSDLTIKYIINTYSILGSVCL